MYIEHIKCSTVGQVAMGQLQGSSVTGMIYRMT